MAHPLLSLVLIAREGTSLRLQRTLESALQQTYEPKMLWVINANPSDSAFTLGLLENLKRFPQASLLPVTGEGTEFYYRNKALEQAGGDYIAFLSDMDMWEPDKAARQIAQLEVNPDTGAAFCNALVLRETVSGTVGSALFESAEGGPQVWMLEKSVAYGSQVLYRTGVVREMQGFDERLSVYGDLEMVTRIAGKRDVLFTDQIAVRVHIPPAQNLRARQYADGRYLLQKHMDFFLLHKRAAFDFLVILARQSADNRKLPLAATYLLRAVLKQPLWAAQRLCQTVARRLWSWHRRMWRRLIVRAGQLRLCAMLRSGKAPREPRPLRGDKRRKSTALDHLREYEFVRYSEMTFMRNQTLEYVKIPDYVTVIPHGMFFDCKKLHTVDIPQTVTGIEANAFLGCERLKTVRFADGSLLNRIGAYAFAGCVSLSSLTLSASLSSLGEGAFAGCINLRSLAFAALHGGEETAETNLPNSLRAIPRCAFSGCSSMASVSFQPGSMLETIGSRAFFQCAGLETLRITGTVRSIGAYALAGCKRLPFLDMQTIDSIRSIGPHAFEDCQSLKNLYIPHAVRRIRPYTFRRCLSLKRVKIPQGVKRVGRRAFAGCKLLDTVTLMDDTTAYRRSSFPRQTHVVPYKQAQAD
jgi:hypothetical protein